LGTFQKLEAQERCDASVETLVEGLSSILLFVGIVNKAAKLQQLQTTVAELLNLIEDASRFILDYNMDGAAGEYYWDHDATCVDTFVNSADAASIYRL
jgi:hypothetical protein